MACLKFCPRVVAVDFLECELEAELESEPESKSELSGTKTFTLGF